MWEAIMKKVKGPNKRERNSCRIGWISCKKRARHYKLAFIKSLLKLSEILNEGT